MIDEIYYIVAFVVRRQDDEGMPIHKETPFSSLSAASSVLRDSGSASA